MKQIDRLIINSPYEEPKHYWGYNHETWSFSLKESRRSGGCVVDFEHSKAFDDQRYLYRSVGSVRGI